MVPKTTMTEAKMHICVFVLFCNAVCFPLKICKRKHTILCLSFIHASRFPARCLALCRGCALNKGSNNCAQRCALSTGVCVPHRGASCAGVRALNSAQKSAQCLKQVIIHRACALCIMHSGVRSAQGFLHAQLHAQGCGLCTGACPLALGCWSCTGLCVLHRGVRPASYKGCAICTAVSACTGVWALRRGVGHAQGVHHAQGCALCIIHRGVRSAQGQGTKEDGTGG